MAEISIIVPVYKVENYLYRCIESIISQTFTDYELILIDDGSPDKCGDICEEYAKKNDRIHVIHQKNGGLSAARNAGIDWSYKYSNSTWITFIDSDDWVSPDYLEALCTAAVSNKKDISIGRFLLTSGEDFEADAEKTCSVWKTSAYYLENTVNATVAWGKLYKKKCFDDLRFPVGKLHEDEYIIYRILFKYEEVAVVDQPIYAYYQNPEGIMKRSWSLRRLDALDAFEEQVAFFEHRGYLEIARQRYRILVHDNAVWQERIIKDDTIDVSVKRSVVRSLRKKLKNLLNKYHRYGWVSIFGGYDDFNVYSQAFPVIAGGYKFVESLKKILKRIPILHKLGRAIKTAWKRMRGLLCKL